MKKIFLLFLLSFLGGSVIKSQITFPGSNYYVYKDYYKHIVDSLAPPVTPDSVYYSEGGVLAEYGRFVARWDGVMSVCDGDINKYYELMNNRPGSNTNRSRTTTDPWVEIGPKSWSVINSNHQSGIGPIEFITFFNETVAPNLQHMLCGSTLGGLFYSSDGGDNWQNGGTDDSPAIPWSGIGSACFSANDYNTWYASGSGQGDCIQQAIGLSEGIYRTIDAGASWVKIADHTNFAYTSAVDGSIDGRNTIITKIMVDPDYTNHPNTMYVATNHGLYKSINIDQSVPTFTKIYTSPSGPPPYYYIYDMEFMPSNSSTIYITVYNKSTDALHYRNESFTNSAFIAYTTDAGATWNNLSDNLSAFNTANYDYLTIETSPANSNNLYAYSRHKIGGSVTKYNNGEIWFIDLSTISSGNAYWYKVNRLTATTDNPNYFLMGMGHSFCVDPFDEKIIYVGNYITDGQIYTFDPVTHYSTSPSPLTEAHDDMEDIICSPTKFNSSDPTIVWTACHGGVSKSVTGGTSPIYRNEGLGVAEVTQLANSANEPGYVSTSLFHDNCIITTPSTTPYVPIPNWNPDWNDFTNAGDGNSTYIDPIDPSYVYGAGQNDYWYLNSNYGLGSSPSFDNDVDNYWHNSCGALNLVDPEYFYYKKYSVTYTRDDVWRRKNRTGTLEMISPADFILTLSLSGSGGNNILGMWVNPKKSDDLYVEIFTNGTGGRAYLLRTRNANDIPVNVIWEIVPLPIADTYRSVLDVEFDDNNPDLMYLLFTTQAPWSSVGYGVEMVFRIDMGNPNVVTSLDGQDYTTWPAGTVTDLTGDLPRSVISGLALEKGSNGGMYVSTNFGVYYTNNNLLTFSSSITANAGWQPFGTALPKTTGYSNLKINYPANVIRVGTDGRGAWEHSLYCPPDYDLTLSSPHASDIYEEVEDNIYSTASVNSGINVTYRAGNEILLQPGFSTSTSSYFHAFIHGCNHPGNSFKSLTITYPGNNNDENEQQKHTNNGEYKIYPNPASEELIISKPEKDTEIEEIEITDISGENIINQRLQNELTKLDIKNLNDGMYFIKIKSKLSTNNYKFIKQ